MTRRLLLSYLSITAFVLLVLEVPLGLSFARNEYDRLVADLERDARVMATVVEDSLEGTSEADPQIVADRYAERTGARVVIIDPAGISVADTDRPGDARDFSTRPEFIEALAAGTASGTRHSDTLDQDLVYVAVPVASGGRVLGAVRITYPRGELDDRVRRNWISLAALAGVVLAAVAVVGAVLARSVTRPVRELARAADALANGDLSARAPEQLGPPEIRALSTEFNLMAARVAQLIDVQRAFVADASHELRAPLTALRLQLENLRPGADVDAAVEEVARLSRLVDTLLHLARSEATPGPRVALDLAAIARQRVAVWEAFAEEQGVRLVGETPPTALVASTEDAISQILDNLLSNALDVAPRGSSVTVEVQAGTGESRLHVVDQGEG